MRRDSFLITHESESIEFEQPVFSERNLSSGEGAFRLIVLIAAWLYGRVSSHRLIGHSTTDLAEWKFRDRFSERGAKP